MRGFLRLGGVLWLLVFLPGCGSDAGDAEKESADGPVASAVLSGIYFSERSFSVAEDAAPGTVIGTLLAEAPATAEVEYRSGQTLFEIHPTTGAMVLAAGTKLDHETTASYTFDVTAEVSEAGSVVRPVTVHIADAEEVIHFEAQRFSVAENAPVLTPLGQLQASLYPSGEVRFETFDPQFDVSPSGVISLKPRWVIDYEVLPSYEFEVTAKGEHAQDKTALVTIEVQNVLEQEVIFPDQAFVASEDITEETLIGILIANVIGGGHVTFDANDTKFAVNPESGEIHLAAGHTLDYENPEQHRFPVIARVVDGDPVTAEVTIDVGNSLEAVIAFDEHVYDISEAAKSGTLVGTLSASVGSFLTLEGAPNALRFGGGDAFFAVDEQGKITLAATLDYESATEHRFIVVASAPDAFDKWARVVVRVQNVLENAVHLEDQAFQAEEEILAGTVVGQIAVDDNHGGMVELLATSDVFAISKEGEIRLAAGKSLNYDVAREHTLSVTAVGIDASLVHAQMTIAVLAVERGTVEHPHRIRSLADLQSIATGFANETIAEPLSVEESLAVHYRLDADIDASATAKADYLRDDKGDDDPSNDEYGFIPIGNCGEDNSCYSGSRSDDKPFRGSLDGAGFVIRGLTIHRPSLQGVGLFGVSAGSVSALGLEGASFLGGTYLGGLVGSGRAGLRVRDSYVVGRLAVNRIVGGIFGDARGTTVEDSFFAGTILSLTGDVTGGLVGYAIENVVVRRSFSAGRVQNGSYIGGIGGFYTDSRIESSFFVGEIESVAAHNTYAGGIVGWTGGSMIERVFVLGNIFATTPGSQYLGGIVGYTQNDPPLLRDGFFAGEVLGEGANHASYGGLASIWRPSEKAPRRHYWSEKNQLPGFGNIPESDFYADNDLIGLDLASLKAVSCEESVFSWDHDGDDSDENGLKEDGETEATARQNCAVAGSSFPWDFGTSAELPALNEVIGNALDASAQRALSDFAEAEHAHVDVVAHDIVIAAPSVALRAEENTLSYSWILPSELSPVGAVDGSTLELSPLAEPAEHSLWIVIVERTPEREVVGVYSDSLELIVAAE